VVWRHLPVSAPAFRHELRKPEPAAIRDPLLAQQFLSQPLASWGLGGIVAAKMRTAARADRIPSIRVWHVK
jgi:hypothetical protein